jgi:hypothetical protein
MPKVAATIRKLRGGEPNTPREDLSESEKATYDLASICDYFEHFIRGQKPYTIETNGIKIEKSDIYSDAGGKHSIILTA